MKKIIDANYFQDPALKAYLSSSKENFVVFNDYACMESYKGNSIKSISKSLEIVSSFPDQVIVLKNTREIVRLTLQSSDPRQLEDIDQSKRFRHFCHGVRLAALGDETLKRQIIAKGMKASAHLNALRNDAIKGARGISELKKSFKPEHLSVLRKNEPISSEMASKIIRDILLLAAFLYRDHPDVDRMPKANELSNSYIFRIAVCVHLLALKWISDGGPGTVSLGKLSNDLVDMNYAAHATYFDGLLTRDKKMMKIYQDACFVLEKVFDAQLGMKT
jgi:hypothetical protein